MKLPYVALATLLIVGCAGQPTPSPLVDPVEVTREVEVTRRVEVTQLVEVTRQVEVEVTRLVTEAPVPTNTEGAVNSEGEKFALNYQGVFSSGGLEIEIVRILFGSKASIPQDFSPLRAFDNADVLGFIAMRITNTTDDTLSVYPDQGQLIIGSEQIELADYIGSDLLGYDDVGGDIFPGVVKLGGFWFGVRRTPLEEITSVRYTFTGPFNSSFDKTGEDFDITLNVSNHEFQPLPDEFN